MLFDTDKSGSMQQVKYRRRPDRSRAPEKASHRGQPAWRFGNDTAQGGQAIRPIRQGFLRLEAEVALGQMPVTGSHIGRVGDDKIELA